MQTITPQTLADTMYHHGIPVLTYQIRYPSFTTTCSPEAAQLINEIYTQEARRAEGYCRTVLFPSLLEQVRYLPAGSNFPGYQWLLGYQVTYNRGCITSLYSEQYSYLGGAHGLTLRTSDTWNFKNGQRLTLADFWNVPFLDIRQRASLLQSIERQIQKRLLETPGSYFEDYPVLLRQSFRPESFYLVPAGIVFYYQLYDIAPYASGIPEFLLHPDELALPETETLFGAPGPFGRGK